MLDLEIKQYIREFVQDRLKEGKIKMPFGAMPVFYVREDQSEKFIDDMWVYINSKKMSNEK